MFLITNSSLTGFLLLVFTPYLILIAVGICYTLLLSLSDGNTWGKSINPSLHSNFELTPIFITPLLLLLSTITLFSITTDSLIFGHLCCSKTNLKLFLIFSLLGCFTLKATKFLNLKQLRALLDLNSFLTFFIFSTLLLFFSNSVVSFIFLIELVTLQILILTVLWNSSLTPQFSHNLGLHSIRAFSISSLFDALFFFFWTSFFVTIGLFLTLILLLKNFISSDWFLLETVAAFEFIRTGISTTQVSLPLLLFVFLSALLVKSALVPFFFWKPVFFKFLSPQALFVYIVFFYTIFFSWTILFWFSLSPTTLSVLSLPLATLLGLGFFLLLACLGASTRFKEFLAISSIFNTFLLWYALTSQTPLLLLL